jgi:MYXO-CTERM domain-containing protein
LIGVTVLATRHALAAGSFSIKTPSVSEKDGEWHIKVRIDLPRAPGMMHTPMRFTFSKEAVDERAIMSKGAEPEHHRMVIDTPPKQIVSMDVDFADASGKVFKSTYFEFDLQRASGYFEAGEYLVMLSGPDGDVGAGQRLTLKGDNPPVYRGAMVFDSKATKQKGPKIESVSSGLDGGSQSGDSNDTSSSAASSEVAPVGSAPSMVPSSAYNRTPEEEAVQGHPKGCGCRVTGVEAGTAASATVALFGLALVAVRRRRK